ncbi:hypothetical protein RJT34_12985 [Clitoria ternatea]|uniref:Uncharacterized protein n=1 Tax=Clitoria ternatea TaxID=43366 RepID=A0AAN9PJU2_CLITE
MTPKAKGNKGEPKVKAHQSREREWINERGREHQCRAETRVHGRRGCRSEARRAGTGRGADLSCSGGQSSCGGASGLTGYTAVHKEEDLVRSEEEDRCQRGRSGGREADDNDPYLFSLLCGILRSFWLLGSWKRYGYGRLREEEDDVGWVRMMKVSIFSDCGFDGVGKFERMNVDEFG